VEVEACKIHDDMVCIRLLDKFVNRNGHDHDF